MKKILLIALILPLGACETIADKMGLREPTCLERVYTAQITLNAAVLSTIDAVEGNIISQSDGRAASVRFKQAQQSINAAQPLCGVDEEKADEKLGEAQTRMEIE